MTSSFMVMMISGSSGLERLVLEGFGSFVLRKDRFADRTPDRNKCFIA